MALVSFLRTHCPWDRAQTPRSLIKHLVEESHEVADAILRDDPEGLQGELGDLLLNLAFQLVIAEESGRFSRGDVWTSLEDKMRRRHPHLFDLGDPVGWDEAKHRETTPGPGALAGLPATLPPLAKATALGRRASRVGFDWDDASGAVEKIREELDELVSLLASGSGEDEQPEPAADRRAADADVREERATPRGVAQRALEEEVGDLLFAVVNVSRHAGVDAATALARANVKFQRRFQAVEALASERDLPMPGTPLDRLDRLWDEVKSEGDRP